MYCGALLQVWHLAESYAPSTHWFLTTTVQLFELGGAAVDPALGHSLMRLVAQQDEQLHLAALGTLLPLLDRPKLPDVLLQVTSI